MKKNRNERIPRRGIRFRKIVQVMKWSFVLLFVSCMQLSATVYSQQEKMSISVRDVSIEDLIKTIKSQVPVDFLYNLKEIERNGTVSVNMRNATVEDILQAAFRGKSLTYTYVNGVFVIRPMYVSGKDSVKRMYNVTGLVLDPKKQPLPGVTIRLDGTVVGTASNSLGEFIMTVPQDTGRLIFTFVGFKQKRVAFKAGQRLVVTLEEEVEDLDEVVVTGYQVINRKKLTSAITSVKMEDIMIPGATSIDQMLEGRIQDLMLTTNSGEVGVVPRLRIRGTSTLIGNREPLWVVDGIVVNDPVPLDSDVLNDPDYVNRIGNAIAGLNPQDIERLDVLKDAAATTLYGTRAANGVIVITTKKGHIGKPLVRYNVTATYKRRPRYSDRQIDLMSSKERVDLSRELVAQSYVYPSDMSVVGYEYLLQQLYSGVLDDEAFAREVKKIENNNTDWFAILTRDVISHNHTLSISGGTESLRYYSSIGYSRDNDVIRDQEISRYTGNLSLDANLYKWLTAAVDFNASIGKRAYEQSDIGSINYAYMASRTISPYGENGELSYYKKNINSSYGYDFNILNEKKESYTSQDNNNFNLSTQLNFLFTDYLNANILFNYAVSNVNAEGYWGEKTWHAATLRMSNYGETAPARSLMPYGGELTAQNTRNTTYTLRFQINLNKYFGRDDKHNLNGTLGYEMSSSRYEGYQNVTRGYYADRGKKFTSDISSSDYATYANWVMSNVPTITDNLTNLIGAYITLTYSYQNLFSINANTRYDGSNKFGSRSNEKLLPVWAISGAFNVSELPGIENEWLNFLSLKMSYGYQGNMLDGQSPELLLINNPKDSYYNKFTSSVSSYPNPDLKWERTGSFNVGLELSMLDNRIQISGDYYRKRTKDAFMNKPISSVNGQNSYVINSGEILNIGYNVSLNLVPVKTNNFKWSFSTMISKTKNKLNTQPNADVHELSDFLTGTALVKGKAVSTFYSYRFVGLNPLDGGPLFDDYSDRIDLLKNMDKYDTYTTVLKATGKRDPSISGNLYNNFSYKRIRASVVFAYSLGASLRLSRVFSQAIKDSDNRNIYSEYNVGRALLNRWKVPGDEKKTIIPAILSVSDPGYGVFGRHWSVNSSYEGVFIADNYWDMYDYCDARVVSADYLKCSNVSLSYVFPEKWLKKAGISRLESTLSATNLFTICSKKLKGQTPTQSVFSQIQLSERPTNSLGLNVSF